VSLAKTAEPIEMPFGLRTQVGPGNHLLDGDPYPALGRRNFEGGKGRPIVKYRDTLSLVISAETDEPIQMPFGLWLGWAQGIMY